MSDLNCYSFTGRLGADAETKYAQSGTCITSFRVATGYGYGDKKGTNWLTVKLFGKQAEGLGKLELQKGQQVAVSGELRVSEYEKRDGTQGYSVEVHNANVSLLGGKPDAKPQSGGRRERPAPVNGNHQEPDDDIPFD